MKNNLAKESPDSKSAEHEDLLEAALARPGGKGGDRAV